MANLNPFRLSLVSFAVIALSRAFCLIHATVAAFSAAVGALWRTIPIDPRLAFDASHLIRPQTGGISPAGARQRTFSARLMQRFFTRRHGAAMNSGIASAALC